MSQPFRIPTDWTFRDKQVVAGFDRHVREQLPFYELVSGAVAHAARHYLPHEGRLYDIGASTGNLTNLLRETLVARTIETHSIDNADEMRDKFTGFGTLEVADATTYEYKPFDVAVLFLVLMFVNPSERRPLLRRLLSNAKPGAAIIIVDKINDFSPYVATVMRRLTIAGKVASGANSDDIIRKELSLGGIQRPIEPTLLPPHAQQFFRWGEFAGWIIEKPQD